MHISSSQSLRIGPDLRLREIVDGGYIVPSPLNAGAGPVVSSGVTVSGQTISSGVDQTILKGAAAIDTTVLGDGLQGVHGTATGTVLTGSVVSNHALISEQIVYAGGVAVRTTVGANALQQVQGSARATLLESGGRQSVLSNGSAVNTIIRRGEQRIESGGVASGAIVRGMGSQIVAYGGTAIDTTLSGGEQTTLGTAIGTIIESRGRQVVSTQATSTTIAPGGIQEVDRGGIAVQTIVENGGIQQVEYSGVTTGTVIRRGGEEILYSNGVASNVTVDSGGLLIIGSGSIVTGLTVVAGGKVIQEVLTSGVTSSGIIVSSGLEQVVSSGATAIDTTVLSGGQFFYAGGKVTGLVAQAGASEIAENRIIVSGVKIGSGVSLSVGHGAVESGGTIARDGYEVVSQGATATGTLVRGEQEVFGGATGVVVESGGKQVIHFAASGTILKGGEQDFSYQEHDQDHVSAVGTIIENGGVQRVSPMDVAISSTVVSGGKLIDQGYVLDAVVSSGGLLTDEGSVSDAIVTSGGVLTLLSGSYAGATTLDGGTEIISAGGYVDGGTAFSGGGQLTLLAAASFSSVTLSGFDASAKLDLASYSYGSGAKLSFAENAAKTKGTLTITDGALTATLILFGSYVAAGFHLASDGASGTMVTYSPDVTPTAHPPLAAGPVG